MKIIILLFFAVPSFAQNTCDDETLARFRARAECWYSITEKNCQSLPFFAGTAVGAAMGLKGTKSSEYLQLKKYLINLKSTSQKLLNDYRDVLRTFYDLKKNSNNPQFSEKISELRFEDYKMFEKELKKAHPQNSFIQRFDEYGNGRANDIFQRTLSYANSGSANKVPMDHFFNTMSPTLQLDLNRSFQIFREISVEKGYIDNGDPKWDSPESRTKIQITLNEQKAAMREDLKSLAKTNQSGRATIRAMGMTAGLAGALSPVVDFSRRRTAILSCAQQLGIQINEDEAEALMNAIEMKGLLSHKNSCDSFDFTGEKLDTLLAPENLTPELKKYFCSLESKMAEKQNSMDDEVDWQHAECTGNTEKSKKPIQITYQKNNWTEIRTRQGVELSIRTNSRGEWDYHSLKSLNDPNFNQYIQDKIKHPMSYKLSNSKHMNPRVLCDGRDSGRYAENLCDVAKALRVAGQTRKISSVLCENSKPQHSADTLPVEGTNK